MTRTASAIAIVLAALALTPADVESATLTGCVTKGGAFVQAAPGTRPAGGKCRGSKAKKVTVPVAVNAGKPGSAIVDSYTFFAEVRPQEVWEGIFDLTIGEATLVGLSARCSERPNLNVAEFWPTSHLLPAGVDSAEGRSPSIEGPPNFDGMLAEQVYPGGTIGPRLGRGVKVFHMLNSYIRARIEVAATVNDQRPALCTFSGTVDIIRAP